MWNKLLLTGCLLTIANIGLMAQQSLAHYYIKVDGRKSTTDGYDYKMGKVTYADDYTLELQSLDLSSPDGLLTVLAADSSVSATSGYDLTIYIHGMWADQKHVWKKTAKNLSRAVLDCEDTPQLIVSIIWESTLLYQPNVNLAYDKGQEMSVFFGQLLAAHQSAKSVNVIAHSMGNRLFQGLIEDHLPAKKQLISKYILVGADLESDIFEKNNALADIRSMCQEVVVYVHNNDRTLKVSKLLNKNDRLGLQGVSRAVLDKGQFKTVDVSLIADEEGLSGGISNHRYYYTSPLVRADMHAELHGKKSACRVPLEDSCRYKIDPSLEHQKTAK